MDDKSKSYWNKVSETIKDQEETTNKRLDMAPYDHNFIKEHISKDDDILDIGSGSGLVTNRMYNDVNSIIAVETFEGLSKFIVDDPSIMVINAQLQTFKIRKEFDHCICTGVTQFFNLEDITLIYSNIFSMLKKGGKLIMRSHCGKNEDVIINGFSEELQTDYFAEYRQLDKEKELLKSIGFSKVESFDILPDKFNVWNNTRHFHFVCTK